MDLRPWTPYPTYLGLMVHTHTRKSKRVLVDRYLTLGLASYMSVSSESQHRGGGNVYEQFQRE